MSGFLKTYYFNNLLKFKTRDAAHLNLILKKLNSLLPNNNNEEALIYLFCVWVVIAFNEASEVSRIKKSNLVWVEKYTIISKIVTNLKKFIQKLNYHFLDCGDGIKLEDEIVLKELIWSVLYVLVNSFLIQEIEWKTKQPNDLTHKSSILLSVQDHLVLFKNQTNLKLNLKPLSPDSIIDSKYAIEDHYLNLNPLIKKNKYSSDNSKFENTFFILNRSNMKLYIRWGLFKFLKNLLINHYNLHNQITSDGLISILDEKRERFWSKKYQREFNHLFSLNYFFIVEGLEEFIKNGFYFRYYFDFRGRLYADSPISYTHNKYFRFVYHYGQYTNDELDDFKKLLDDEDIKHANFILLNTNIYKKYQNVDFTNKLNLYYLQVVFFEIGKLFKNKLINSLGGVVPAKQFIEAGVEYYNNNESQHLNIEQLVEYWSIVFILEELNQGVFLKIPVFQDATASGLQILLLILGAANPKTYEQANFVSSDSWNDTYYHVINNFLSKVEIPHDYLKYFNRSTLKKTIMTFNYKATYIKCWGEFKEDLNLPWEASDPLNIEISIYFKKFYQYLKKIFESDIYFTHPPTIITSYFNKQFIGDENYWFLTNDNFSVFLKYQILSTLKRTDRIIPGIVKKRKTSEWVGLSNAYDSKKTLRAVQANFVHAMDAYLLRVFFKEFGESTITIHDSIGVPILKLKKFKKIIKKVMQQLYDENPMGLTRDADYVLKVSGNFIFL